MVDSCENGFLSAVLWSAEKGGFLVGIEQHVRHDTSWLNIEAMWRIPYNVKDRSSCPSLNMVRINMKS